MYRIAIIRSACSAVSRNQYNIQEIGLAKQLAQQGMMIDVFLISDRNETYTEKLEDVPEVTVYWLKGIKIPGQQGYYRDLKKILNQHKYDLIQALDDTQITTVLVSQYCRKRGIKFVLWQGMYENYPETYKRMIQYVFDWTLLKVLRKNTRYCIAKTTAAAGYLSSKKFPEARVIPVGLELSNFRAENKIDYREQFQIKPEEKILLYVGKVEERRKPLFCLDVYKELKSRHPNWRLIYVGKGPLAEEVRQCAVEQNIQGVDFVEQIPQKNLPSLYEISDFFILPTRYEIFGMVLLEAMYFGTPVITYWAAGPLDVITHGKDGLLMKDFDVSKWADAIEKYEHMSHQMGMAARKKIKERYLWDSIAREYHEEYVRIIEGH